MAPVKVHVVYCGGMGYASRFRRFQQDLKENFGDDVVEVTGESTTGITGFFEISVNGTLVHSKKNGDGFVDNDEKHSKINEAVRDAAR